MWQRIIAPRWNALSLNPSQAIQVVLDNANPIEKSWDWSVINQKSRSKTIPPLQKPCEFHAEGKSRNQTQSISSLARSTMINSNNCACLLIISKSTFEVYDAKHKHWREHWSWNGRQSCNAVSIHFYSFVLLTPCQIHFILICIQVCHINFLWILI